MQADAPTRACTKCRVAQPVSNFRKGAARDGLHYWCKSCTAHARRELRKRSPEKVREADRQRYAANPHAKREARLKHYYGISVEQYNALFEKQGGLCAICGRPETRAHRDGRPYNLAVDHDHGCCPGPRLCGACVRGLLCRDCNTAVGLLGESPDRVAAALAYLRTGR
jgi:hypothetical protein